MAKRIDLTLVLPCFNEWAVLAESLPQILNVLLLSKLSFQIIFVDDGSTDATPKLIKQLVKKNKKFQAIYHKENLGRGKSVLDGIKKARGLVVGYIDLDLEVSPVYIPLLAKKVLDRECDIAVGRRIGQVSFKSITYTFLAYFRKTMIDMVLKTGGIDVESGCKFFYRKKVAKILKKTRHQHWFWDTEVLIYAKKLGYKIIELPVLFQKRYDKKSAFRTWGDTIDTTRNLMILWRRINVLNK
jgi:glycosyltransferase involved in cell wall biosynthesis